MNRVILVGRLTKDPELKGTNSGVRVAPFTVAVNRTFTSQNGERETDFINCIAFNKQAENLCKFIRKGGLVGVEGRIQTRSYNDPQDGTRKFVTEVVCDNVHFLGPKGQSQSPYPAYDDITPYDMPQQSFNQQRPQPKGQFNDMNQGYQTNDDYDGFDDFDDDINY